MKASISNSIISGSISAPPSKSYTLRALMCAAIANGKSQIINPLKSDDTYAARNVLTKVGATIEGDNDRWLVTGGNIHQTDSELFCGESAGIIRFMTALCSLIPGKSILTAGPTLMKRPMGALINTLQQIGVNCRSTNGFAPITIEGGVLKDDTAKLAGNISSQFLSALLFIAPLAEKGLKIHLTTQLESESYVRMTLACMEEFGILSNYSPDLRFIAIKNQHYKPAKYFVEGDWSSISYLLALGAVAGEITVEHINIESLQGDRKIIDLLKAMGALVYTQADSVVVKKSKLHGIEADLNDCIDLLPTIAVLAAVASGTSRFRGIARARFKESNRLASVQEGLLSMGIQVQETEDTLIITGSSPRGTIIDSKDDHRIAMAFSTLGVITGNTTINGAECVNKTYPEFWEVFKNIGGKVVINE